MSLAVTNKRTFTDKALPCMPGYTMGGVVPTINIELPFYYRLKVQLKEKIKCIKFEKLTIREIKTPDPTKERQREMIILSKEETRLETGLKEVNNIIYKKLGMDPSFKTDPNKVDVPWKNKLFFTMLPIDFKESPIRIHSTSYPSEHMHHFLINHKNAENQLRNLHREVEEKEYSESLMPLIEQVSTIVNSMLKDEQEIGILASFVNLNRVKTLDPIRLRKTAPLDKEITKNSDQYSVINQAVLGGVFIGYGSYTSASEYPGKKDLDKANTKPSPTDAKLMSTCTRIFSYISQGAIPLSKSFNLWDTYIAWKEKLISDKDCGYPIAFKAINLTDVLVENNIKIPSSKSPIKKS